MRIQVKIIIFIFFSLYISNLHAQQVPKLYIGITGLNKEQKEFFSANKISFAYIFYQPEISTADGDSLNKDLFAKKINEKIPNTYQTGIAVLDWESPKIFKENSDSNSYLNITNEFIKCIKLAKKLRPNIKWAFYGLPIRTFNGINQKWLDANNNLLELLKYADFLAPSLYLYNPKYIYNSNAFRDHIYSEKNKKATDDYLLENLNEALKIGQSLNKEVYPFIWHRMGGSLSLAPLGIFKHYVQIILSDTFSGKRVAGIIWWDGQEYYYLNRKRYPALLQEYKNVENVNDYNYKLLKKYYISIAQFLKQ